MKGQRSHRPSSSEPDDWGDGSWTVDCSCGVNFDDGEEMVNCDECGVWVHTRCSRFVKGETSFACDKCNIIKKTEETEVAELLAELPTKTMRMDTCPAMAAPPAFRPEVPMEDRVHVQGVPYGDFALFEGLGNSKVFSPQLWKCIGYVPKRLNFQYREFPCWDEEKENVDVVPLLQSRMQLDLDRPGGLEDVVALKAVAIEATGGGDWEKEAPIMTFSKEKSVAAAQDLRHSWSRRSDGKGFGSHHRHDQGLKGDKRQHHHHHGHHHGRRKKDDGGGFREHGVKKRMKPSGEKEKEGKLKKKVAPQDGGHGSRGLMRLMPKNPKAMRNLAAQNFLDDDMKARNKVETHEPACHESACGSTHEKFEFPDCETEEAIVKFTSLENRVIKSEGCRETSSPDTELGGLFKKHEPKKNVEKSKSISAMRIHSTEMLNDSFICTVSSESQVKIDKNDFTCAGKMARISPRSESVNVQPEESEIAEVLIKQEQGRGQGRRRKWRGEGTGW